MATNTPGATTTFESEADVGSALARDEWQALFETMLLGRALDERMWLLNRAGQAPFAVSGQGHEAAQAGVAFACDPARDWLVPYYRDLTMVLRWGISARDVMLHMLARAADPNSGGRQMPGHYSSRERRVLSGSSPIATQIPHATGVAFAAKARGEDTVVVTCFGDGATSQGDFHEAVNFATIYDLPVVFFCQNNGYAISVPLEKQMGVERVSERAAGYAIPGYTVDGLDAVAVYEVAQEAVARARRGEGPTLIEAIVRRFQPHSSDDDDRTYRPAEELADLRSTGPIRVTRARLTDMGVIDEAWEAEAMERIKQTVNDATDFAEKSPLPEPDTFARNVFADSDS
jgi:2-oxoisovalerate dehydrogenase E1 component alpha subunit